MCIEIIDGNIIQTFVDELADVFDEHIIEVEIDKFLTAHANSYDEHITDVIYSDVKQAITYAQQATGEFS